MQRAEPMMRAQLLAASREPGCMLLTSALIALAGRHESETVTGAGRLATATALQLAAVDRTEARECDSGGWQRIVRDCPLPATA